MKTAVKICLDFVNWQDLQIGTELITNFETAIKIVRASGLKSVQLEQDVNEWDNF